MTHITLHLALGAATLSLAVFAGCTHNIKVDPIKVEPIDITLHIYLEADQKLDEFFGDDDPVPTHTPTPPPEPSPANPEGANR
ncbi:MAG: hypothetical protein IT435_10410 [Phycisphaerales bacterium]|nr:hypothetical protein [Phycisphaerales bacterium]